MHFALSGERTKNPHMLKTAWLPQGRAEWSSMVADPSALRFMWVRNPYARLLSGFLDKAVSTRAPHFIRMINNEYGGPYNSTPAEFGRFVERIIAMRAQNIPIDAHFSPLTEHCGINKGMRYNFYLKVEEADVWYVDLVSFLGLDEAASSGWGLEVTM